MILSVVCKNIFCFSWSDKDLAQILRQRLSERLDLLCVEKHNDPVDESLRLRTCNRAIDALISENGTEPSSIFIWMLSCGNPLALVAILLKLVLISRHSRIHLETRIAQLIRYYEHLPEEECQWVIHFFELFKIAFAIHAENVEYSLVEVGDASEAVEKASDRYRVFARLKYQELSVDISEEIDDSDDEFTQLLS